MPVSMSFPTTPDFRCETGETARRSPTNGSSVIAPAMSCCKEERVQGRHHPYRHGAAGIHAAPRRPGAPSALTNPLPWRAGAERKVRSEIIPSPVEQATEPACDHAQAQGAPARMSWARLQRVFDIDIDHCPNWGGSLKIIAAIEDPVIVRILTHLTCRPAPRRASRRRESIYSRQSESRKPLAYASRRRRSL